MDKIRQHIEELFSCFEQKEGVRKAKEQLLEMSEDKYQDFIDQGCSEQEAGQKVIEEFGTLEELEEILGEKAKKPVRKEKPVYPEEVMTELNGELKAVDVNVSRANIRIVRGNEDSYEISDNDEKNPVTVRYHQKTGKLEIRQTTNSFFRFFTKTGMNSIPTVVVQVNGPLEKLEIENSSGDVSVDSVEMEFANLDVSAGAVSVQYSKANTMEIDASCGSVRLEKVVAKEVNVDCSAGQVSISNSMITDLSVDSSAGNVVLDRVHGEIIEVDTSAGKVKLNDVDGKKMDVDCSAGDVQIHGVRFEELNVDNSMGKVEIEADCSYEETRIMADVSMGCVTVDGHRYGDEFAKRNGTKELRVDCGIGDVAVTFLQ
ncbi:MAG: DUF4097 family beta strand repeat protein [Erysipelotrichaceae bacterium]|nr:DUF4097 family beta strand repeat protein [Erysipelotrichaceae bacterium]